MQVPDAPRLSRPRDVHRDYVDTDDAEQSLDLNVASPEFRFIDGRDKSYSSQTRRFVLRRHLASRPKRVEAVGKRRERRSASSASFEGLHRLEKVAVDPFDTLPLKVTSREFYLIQHCKTLSPLVTLCPN